MQYVSRIRAALGVAMLAALLAGCPGAVREPAPGASVPKTPTPTTPPPKEAPKVVPTEYPTQVALLLPLSGRQQSAGIAVRDGFFAGYFQQDPARRPKVRVYDIGQTGADDSSAAANLFLRAVDDGAQFVVGPLTKEGVGAAAGIADGHVPTLALNFLADGVKVPQNFYQFALAPEDEARQVAQRVLADKRPRGVALVPAGDWGTRVLNAFADELTVLGGELVARGTYIPSESDHSPAILKLLKLSDSRDRYERLVSMLGTKLEFQPRRRGDIDFIFVAGTAQQSRLIRPQLRFHYAGDIPMYTTSDAFEPDETENVDLDGVMFPDMPWMIAPDADLQAVRDSLQQAWPVRLARRGRLYAFGLDAYKLIPLLSYRSYRGTKQTSDTLNGATGKLTLDGSGRIHRDLQWALIRNGRPLPQPAP